MDDDDSRQTGRSAGFGSVVSYILRETGLLDYVLRDAGPSQWRGTFNLTLPIEDAAIEMAHTYETKHLLAKRKGPKSKKPVLHAVLGWHSSDLAWLTADHLRDTVRDALKVMGLAERQAVWSTHTNTGKPHIHIVANLVHPETGDIARLGLIKKRMSTFCGNYEKQLGDIRCRTRFVPKTANENRRRIPKLRMLYEKLKASIAPASRP